MAGDDNEVFVTRSLNVTPKTTEQHLIERSSKSEAEVTNNLDTCVRCVVFKLTMTDMKRRAASLRQQSYLFYSSEVSA